MYQRILLGIFILTFETHLSAAVWPGDTWQTANPESQGVNSAKLNQAMSYLASKCGSAGAEQAVVVRNGYMIWKGSDIDNAHNVWSASKSFTSTVLSLLIDDGKCTLDTYAKDYISSLSSDYSDVKLRHFATMTSGYNAVRYKEESVCQSHTPFEPASPQFSPGSSFKYCDDAMNEFANVLTRIAGEDIESFLKDRIADPIGMNDAKWDWGDWGTIDGMVVNGGAGNKGKGIHISAHELARFGLLFLNRGNWNGRQLISSSWVDQATSVQVPSSLPGSDGCYCYNWWRLSGTPVPTYMASGYNNNKCIVIRDWDMVIVRLGKDGSIDKSIYATFLDKIEDALDSGPLPGQIIVDPDHPEWLIYNGDGPFFMCGPGDPEDFLYRGSRNSDGTRSGDQMKLINKLKGTGANCIYMQAVRSHGGDGDSTHNPFVGSNPSKGLDQDILDQWEGWFTEMDNNGIVIFFFFYDDSACIWKTGDSVGAEERAFIQGLVNKFKHHKHLIWCVAEEYSEKYSRERVSNIAAEIRSADKYNHVIAVHQHSGTSFSEFANDLNIEQFAMQIGASSVSGLHRDCVKAWNGASGRYNVNVAEGTNHVSGGSTEIRKKSWAAAMGGAYVMIYEMFIDDTPTSDLQDCGRLVSFFESTDFDTMVPHDDLKNGNTDYVLANPGHSYIAYASGPTTTIGLKNMTSGTYSFKWFDCKDGDTVEQNNMSVSSGDQTWNKPSEPGNEIAVYITSSNQSLHTERRIRSARIHFTDVSKMAGIQGLPDFGGHAAAVADLNGDGWEEICVTNCGNMRRDGAYFAQPNLLFMNNGDGTFRETAKEARMQGPTEGDDPFWHGAVFADFSHDGIFDLVLGAGNPAFDNMAFLNDGQGHFTVVTPQVFGSAKFGTRAVCVGDVNGDGYLDIYVTNGSELAGKGGGHELEQPVPARNFFLNDGTGKFTRADLGVPYTGFTQGATLCDLNNDGHLDLIEAKWGGNRAEGITLNIYFNDGKGHFTDVTADLGLSPRGGRRLNGVEVGDFDNDGWLDLVCFGDADGGGRLLRNEKGRRFVDVTQGAGLEFGNGFSAVFGDVDNDGWLDLLVLNTRPHSFALYRNMGNGTFEKLSKTGLEVTDTGGASVRAGAFFDCDHDGRLDVFIVRKRDFNLLFRNETQNDNGWLRVQLAGVKGDAGGVGANVWIYSAGHLGDPNHLLGYRQAINSRAYVVQHSPILHFGLGEAQTVDVRAAFPGGKIVEYQDVSSRKLIYIDGRE